MHVQIDQAPHILEDEFGFKLIARMIAGEAGFKDAYHVSGVNLRKRYFANRTDGLRLGDAEALLIATT